MKREYLSREKEITYCSKLKKGMLKTKKLLKIARYIRWKEPSVQAAEVEEICIYQNLERDRHSIYIWK